MDRALAIIPVLILFATAFVAGYMTAGFGKPTSGEIPRSGEFPTHDDMNSGGTISVTLQSTGGSDTQLTDVFVRAGRICGERMQRALSPDMQFDALEQGAWVVRLAASEDVYLPTPPQVVSVRSGETAQTSFQLRRR